MPALCYFVDSLRIVRMHVMAALPGLGGELRSLDMPKHSDRMCLRVIGNRNPQSCMHVSQARAWCRSHAGPQSTIATLMSAPSPGRRRPLFRLCSDPPSDRKSTLFGAVHLASRTVRGLRECRRSARVVDVG